MELYTLIISAAAVIAGIIIAFRSKKSEGVTYGTLDKIGIATNIILIPVYCIAGYPAFFLGMVSAPSGEGLLWFAGLVASVIIASPAVFCALGLGFSVALRKKGKSVPSFLIQFAGAVGICLSFILYGIAEPILRSLN